jgi:hypothetical protein
VVIVQSVLPISTTRAPLCKTIMRQCSDLYFRVTLFESANRTTSCNKYVELGPWIRSFNPSSNPTFTSMPRSRKRPGCFNCLSRSAIRVYLFPSFETIIRISEIHRFEARSLHQKKSVADPVSRISQTTEFTTCASDIPCPNRRRRTSPRIQNRSQNVHEFDLRCCGSRAAVSQNRVH